MLKKSSVCSLTLGCLVATHLAASPLQGVYFGVGATYTQQGINQHLDFDPDKVESIPLHYQTESQVNNLQPALFLGYGYNLNNFYAGIELDANPNRQHYDLNTANFSSHLDKTKDYAASLRLGYLITPKILAYGLAGLTQTRFDGKLNFVDGGAFKHGDLFLKDVPDLNTGTLTGKQLGAGLSVALTQNLSLRAEYQHVIYNDTLSFDLDHSQYDFFNPLGAGSIKVKNADTLGLGISYQLTSL